MAGVKTAQYGVESRVVLTPDDERRLLSKVLIGDGCWEWQGGRTPSGYGFLSVRHRQAVAHRLFYKMFVGPVPQGKELHHVCGQKGCCNPSHLKPVTRKEHHLLDGRDNGLKTHCPQGHPYSPENTSVRSTGERRCLTCDREQKRAKRAAKLGAG